MHRMSPESALAIIRGVLKNTVQGIVSFTKHALQQMVLRGYTTQDVVYILETGQVQAIELKPSGEYHCKIKGSDLEGDKGIVIVSIIDETHLLIITVLGGIKDD